MTDRPYDFAEAEAELDAIFGKPEPPKRAPGRNGSTPHEQYEHGDDTESTTLPRPVCALHAPAPEPITWIVQDLFTAGDVGLIVGDGGSFKSSAAVHIAAAVAGGYKAFDRFETIGGPVLICSQEDPGSVIQMRLEAFVRGHNWDRTQVLGNVHYFAMAGVRIKDPRWKKHLLDTVDELAPSMVVLDPFVDLSGLEEENSNSEAMHVMSYSRKLARRSGAQVTYVHHAAKSQEARGQSRIRGAGAIANASRGTLFFEFTDAGVQVEQLKMTYAEKVQPFMLLRDIHSEPTNRAMWISARLATVKPAEARMTRAQEFVMGQILASPGKLGTRDLRRAAEGTGHRSADIQDAVNQLFAQDLIWFENGPRQAKYWHSKVRAAPVNTVAKMTVSTVPNGPVAQSEGPRVTVPPLKGGTHSHRANGPGHTQDCELDESDADAEDA